MKSPRDLFDLVHSLTPNEKSYFKKTCTVDGGKDKAYVKLFDLLNDMKEFDEQVLQSKVKKIGLNISLSKLKDYLYDAVLNSLMPLYLSKNEDIRFYGDSIKVKILQSKLLYQQAKQMNTEARLAASEQFQNAELAASFMTESLYNRYTDSIDELRSYELTHFRDHLQALEAAKFDALNHMLTNKIIYYVTKHNAIVKPETVEELKKEVGPYFDEFSTCKNTNQIASYYGLAAIYANMTGDLVSEFVYKLECINIYMADEKLQRKAADSTMIAFQNFFYILRLRKQYDLFETTNNLFELFIKNNKQYLSTYGLTLIDQIALLNRFLISKDMGKVAVCSELCSEMQNWAIESKSLLPYYRMIALINLVDYYYCQKNYKEAIRTIQLLFQTSTVKYSKFTATALFYQVLIHFEEGDYQIVTHLIGQLYRYMLKSNIDSSIMKLFVKAIRLVASSPNYAVDRAHCDEMLDLIYLPENKHSAILETFSLEYWYLARKNGSSYYQEFLADKISNGSNFKDKIMARRKEMSFNNSNLFPEFSEAIKA